MSGKQPIAVLLAAAIAVPAPVWTGVSGVFCASAYAEDPAPVIDPGQAKTFFESKGVFQDQGDKKDPLRTYLFDNSGKLTKFGEVLYQYLQTDTVKRVETYQPSFQNIRELGEAKPEQIKAIDRRMEKFKGRIEAGELGKLSEEIARLSANGFDELKLRGMLGAGFDGAASGKKSDQPKYTQITTRDEFLFVDDKGVAVRMARIKICRGTGSDWPTSREPVRMTVKHYEGLADKDKWICGDAGGATTFSRDLQKKQKEMNDPNTRPPGAPPIPETGRYNVQMLQYSYLRLKDQVDSLQNAYKIDRLVRIAELLGEQYHDEQYLKDEGGKLEKALLERAKRSLDDIPFRHKKMYDSKCGGYVTTVLELVDCKLLGRKEYLDKAQKYLDLYKDRIAAYKDRQVITDQDVQGLQADEQLVSKFVTQSYMGQQRFHADNALERLNFEVKDGVLAKVPGDSPDFKFLSDALDKSTMDEKTREEYRERAGDLAKRYQRLMSLYDNVEKDLNTVDHVTGMGEVQRLLSATQDELKDATLDYTMFVNTPALAGVAKKESSGWNNWWSHKGAWLLNKLSFGKLAQGYLDDRAAMDAYLNGRELFDGSGKSLGRIEGLGKVQALIAAGDWLGARAHLLKLAPDAPKSHWLMDLAQAQDAASDTQRVQAVFRKMQGTVGRVAQVQVYTGIAVSFVTWTAAMAVAAPIASAALSGVARGAFAMANTLRNMSAAASAAGQIWRARLIGSAAFIPHAVGCIAEHSAIRLASLSAAPNKLYASTRTMRVLEGVMVRGVNMGARLGSFAFGLAGGLSGTMNMGMYYKNQLIGDGNMPYRSGWQAFTRGYVQGAQWAVGAGEQWWTPAILFVGIPSNIFEGSILAAPANSLATKGLFGNAGALISKVPGLRWVGKMKVIESLAAGGGRLGALKAATGTVMAIGDQVAKYMFIGQGAGWIARKASFRFNTVDGDNIERRMKRARAAGIRHMMYPYWLLLPTFPAKYELQAHAQQRGQQGFKEYTEAGELDRIANAPESTSLPLKKTPKVPVSQKIFNLRWRGESAKDATFLITKDMKYEAIRMELYRMAGGRLKGAGKMDFAGLNPNKFYEYSMKDEGSMAGRLHVTEEVKDQAIMLFEQSILKRPQLASEILSAKAGSTIQGFGVVRQGTKMEVARILFTNKATVPAAQVNAAKAVLGPYLETEQKVYDQAQVLLDALHSNANPSAKFQTLWDAFMKQTSAWKNDPHAQKGTSYMDLVAKFRQQAKGAGLSPAEAKVFETTFDFIGQVEARFKHYAKVGTAVERADSALAAIQTEYNGSASPSRAVQQKLSLMRRTLRMWKGHNPDGAAPITDTTYEALVSGLESKVAKMKETVSRAEMEIMTRAIKEMKSAPYLLQDSKGGALPGWRSSQFEGLMFFLRELGRDGSRASEVVRTFLLMGTGTGKTLLAYEGLLPIAEADAAARGKKTIYLTVQSNLESQARIEKAALKKLLTKLEVDTWEGFKSKIAEGKLQHGAKPDDYWILGDEMDGAALQPALTIGETTAAISKEATGFRLLKEIGKRMKELMGRGPSELQKRLETQISTQRSLIDSMEPGTARDSLIASNKRLLQLSQSLARMEGRTFAPSADRVQALARARGEFKNLSSGKHAGFGGKQAQYAKELQSLATELDGIGKQMKKVRAGGPGASRTSQLAQLESASTRLVQRIDATLREVQTVRSQVAMQRLSGRIQRLADAQTNLRGMDAARVEQFNSAGLELKNIIANRRSIVGMESPSAETARTGWISRIRDSLDKIPKVRDFMRRHFPRTRAERVFNEFEALLLEQKSITMQAETANTRVARSLERMAKEMRGSGRLAEARKTEAQAAKLLQSAESAKQGLRDNAATMLREIKSQQSGWEGRVRELITKRQGLVDRSVSQRNPIYETFTKMRQDMYMLVNSKMRITETHQLIEEAPNRAIRTLRTHGERLTEATKKLVDKYRAMERAGGGKEARRLRQRAEVLNRRAGKLQAEWHQRAEQLHKTMLDQAQSARHRSLQQARYEARKALVAAENELHMAKTSLSAADPGAKKALQARVEKAQQGVDHWHGKVQEINSQLGKFELAQTKIIQRQLAQYQTEAQSLAKSWNQQLSRFSGPEASSIRSQLGGLERAWGTQIKRLDWTPQKAVEVMHGRITGVGTPELLGRYFLKYTGLRWALSRVPGMKGSRMLKPISEGTVGLTRMHSRSLISAFLTDPFLAPDVRWKMFWTLLPGTLFPRGSWVQTELFNLAKGYTDNPGNVRIDNITGKINVIHNGQWFESMDTPTRRYWELEYGTDLTLPYDHKTIVTMNDFIRDNHNVRFIGFSGTAGKEFREYIGPHNVRLTGVGSVVPENVKLNVKSSATGQYQAVRDAIQTIRTHDAQMAAAGKQANGLVVLSLADTRILKSVRKYLIRTGQVKPSEIAMVISDAELLRLNRPQARIGEQLNLGALTTGKVKVLMLDTRVGGRGLDLNFKGVRGGGPNDFKGYFKYEMLVLDPHLASEAHLVQAMGRIDLGRIPTMKHAKAAGVDGWYDPLKAREFQMVINVKTAAKEPVFMRMLRDEPIFRQMRRYPEVVQMTQESGKLYPDWEVLHQYIERLETKGLQPGLTRRYREVVGKYLLDQQIEVEKSQLRSASVLRDQPIFDQFLFGLQPLPLHTTPALPLPGR